MFSIAAAFGNVHGVYKPGNVVLSPQLLAGHQAYIKEQIKSDNDKPAFLVMHGGSGSTKEEITTAVKNGVVKMNVDTDTQWAYWDGLRLFYKKHEGYLQGQVGNPDGEDKPNKKYYDPRVWVRAAEESMIKRAQESLTVLGEFIFQDQGSELIVFTSKNSFEYFSIFSFKNFRFNYRCRWISW